MVQAVATVDKAESSRGVLDRGNNVASAKAVKGAGTGGELQVVGGERPPDPHKALKQRAQMGARPAHQEILPPPPPPIEVVRPPPLEGEANVFPKVQEIADTETLEGWL